jgi:hypothetical protein
MRGPDRLVRAFLYVPSMLDSLDVKVLYST